jgi:hypothetical protein
MARAMRALAHAAFATCQRKLELLERCGYQNHQTTTQSNRKPIKNSIGVSIIAASLHRVSAVCACQQVMRSRHQFYFTATTSSRYC